MFKDTTQLVAFSNNNFTLGNSAMMLNEGQPLYIVDRLEGRFDLAGMTVGILGMAFKAEFDDTRSSPSYTHKRILRFKATQVFATDPFVTTDPELVPLDQVVRGSNLLIVGVPNAQYRHLDTTVPVVDMWNLRGNGTLI